MPLFQGEAGGGEELLGRLAGIGFLNKRANRHRAGGGPGVGEPGWQTARPPDVAVAGFRGGGTMAEGEPAWRLRRRRGPASTVARKTGSVSRITLVGGEQRATGGRRKGRGMEGRQPRSPSRVAAITAPAGWRRGLPHESAASAQRTMEAVILVADQHGAPNWRALSSRCLGSACRQGFIRPGRPGGPVLLGIGGALERPEAGTGCRHQR